MILKLSNIVLRVSEMKQARIVQQVLNNLKKPIRLGIIKMTGLNKEVDFTKRFLYKCWRFIFCS